MSESVKFEYERIEELERINANQSAALSILADARNWDARLAGKGIVWIWRGSRAAPKIAQDALNDKGQT